jgi:hypothetical protein
LGGRNFANGKKHLPGAEQPFGTIVDGYAPGDAPQPLTLNHPASNPGCSSGWGSSFSGHHSPGQEFATGPLPAAVFDFRQAKNEFNRPPSSGLRTCTIRDEDWFRWLGMRGRDVLLDRQCALRGRQLAASFLARERQEARRQRQAAPNFAHRGQSTRSACFAPSGCRYQAFQRLIM